MQAKFMMETKSSLKLVQPKKAQAQLK